MFELPLANLALANPALANLALANLLTEPVGVAHYVTVGAIMFVCGVLCMAPTKSPPARKNNPAVMFLGSTYWHIRFPEKNFFGLIDAPTAVYDVHEGWERDKPAADSKLVLFPMSQERL